jgi:signal transduction histidine kinase
VKDNGRGISPDKLEKIWEDFYQAEDPMTRRFGGLGLGLPIARVLVELHNGQIWGDSPGLDQGATFTVRIPLSKN